MKVPERRYGWLLLVLGLPLAARGADTASPRSPWVFGVLDLTHDYVSQSVEELATSIDRFFANEKHYQYTNRTYVQIRLDGYWRDRRTPDYTPRLRAKLHLPGTQRRFKLMLESDPQERQSPQDLSQNMRGATGGTGAGDYFLSMLRERTSKSGWNIRPNIGVELKQPLEAFLRLRFDKSYPLGDKWTMRPDQNFYWYTGRGAGSDSYLEFNYRLAKDWLLRSGSFLRWTDRNDFFEPSQNLVLFHYVQPGVQMSYQVGMFGRTAPTLHVIEYLFTVNYRQLLYRDWLFLEMRPQLRYAEAENWRPTRSFLLRFDIVFGRP